MNDFPAEPLVPGEVFHDEVPISTITERCGMPNSLIIECIEEHGLFTERDWLTKQNFVSRCDADLFCQRWVESTTDFWLA